MGVFKLTAGFYEEYMRLIIRNFCWGDEPALNIVWDFLIKKGLISIKKKKKGLIWRVGSGERIRI